DANAAGHALIIERSDERRVARKAVHTGTNNGGLLLFQSAGCSPTERVSTQLGSGRSRTMARRYSRGASKDVERAMRKRRTLKSGRSGRKVKSRTQAIAIGRSEARREGKKVPRRSK